MLSTLKNWFSTGLLASICFTMAVSTTLASEQDSVAIIDGFINQIDKYEQLNPEQAGKLKALVQELRDDEYARSAAISEGLAIVYPEFAAALENLGNDELKPAMELLTKLAASDDPYLAAESTFYMARASMFNQQFEEAIPRLEEVLGKHADHTVQMGNALYFLGIAQGNMLDNKAAIKALQSFVQDYPSAPERMRISAMRQIELLSSIEEGSIYDVYQRMNFSHSRLQTQKTDDLTKREQDKIVEMLAKMIKEEEKKESSGESKCKGGDCDKPGEAEKSGKGQGKSQGKSQAGGGSNNPDGVVRRSFDDGPASAWSQLRDRDRDAAFSSIKEKFPARYQAMVEQYFKSFQTDQP